jgi:DNA-directed RNA polymerase I, II, and III subunit RPABC2
MSDMDDNYSTSSDSNDSNDSPINLRTKNDKIPNKSKSINYDDEIALDDSDIDSMDESEEDEDEQNGEKTEKIKLNMENDDDGDVDEDDNSEVSYDDNNNEIEVEDEEEEEEDDDDFNEGDFENMETKKQAGGKTVKKVNINTTINIDSQNSDVEDDRDIEDENYLQKFNSEIHKNYIMDYHPECLNHNYDEIAALSKVTRDEFNIIIDPLHKTVPYLTKYERARILGQRAKQIECGSKPFVKVPENIIDSNIIAELELQQKKIPFIIRRPLPNGGSEYWNLKDLEIIDF